MSSIIRKPNTNCISCYVLLNDKNMVKNKKTCNKYPIFTNIKGHHFDLQ